MRERIPPETGTSIEIDFYEDGDEFDSRWDDLSEIKGKYKLAGTDSEEYRTTLLVSWDKPVNIKNLERDLSNMGIGILAVDYKSYNGNRYFFKKDCYENCDEEGIPREKEKAGIVEKITQLFEEEEDEELDDS
jgi:hypothetical protein